MQTDTYKMGGLLLVFKYNIRNKKNNKKRLKVIYLRKNNFFYKMNKSICIILIILLMVICSIIIYFYYTETGSEGDEYINYNMNLNSISLTNIREMDKKITQCDIGYFTVPLFMKNKNFINDRFLGYCDNESDMNCFVLESLKDNLFTTPKLSVSTMIDSKDGKIKFFQKTDKGIKMYDDEVLNTKKFALLSSGLKEFESKSNIYIRIPYGGLPDFDKKISKYINDMSLPKWVNSNNLSNFSWFLSKKDSTTNFHIDEAGDGFLLQILGKKKILLAKPEEKIHMIPYENDSVMHRRSKINEDVSIPSIRKKWEKIYPEFKKAKIYEIILNEGEWIRIPHHWWHLIKSLNTPTLSVIMRLKQ